MSDAEQPQPDDQEPEGMQLYTKILNHNNNNSVFLLLSLLWKSFQSQTAHRLL